MDVLAAALARAAVADHDVGARLLLQHESEVLRAGQRRGVGLDILATDRQRRCLDGDRRLLGGIDQRRVAAMVLRDGLAAAGLRDTGRDLGQALLKEIAHVGREAAGGAADQHFRRDHVGRARRAGGDMADAQHGRLAGRHVAADDALHRHDELCGHEGRVGAAVGHGAVAARTLEDDFPAVGRGEHRAGADGEVTDREARHVVHAVNHIARELLEQAFLDHHARATEAFLGGLEDEVDGAAEVGRRRKLPGRAQQHRGVPVMAAGMHLVGNL